MIDKSEVATLAAQWGEPAYEEAVLDVGPDFWLPWGGNWDTRRGEVLFLLPRPGGLLLHRKAFYPPDAWRLLTGGIELGETVAAAIAREPVEEVGLTLPVRRFVALLHCTVRCEGRVFPWATYIFLLPFSDAPLQPSHDDEIAATRTVPLRKLSEVAAQLETLPAPWHDWGCFRARAHRVVQEHVSPEEVQG